MRKSVITGISTTSFINVCFSFGLPRTKEVWALSANFDGAPVREFILGGMSSYTIPDNYPARHRFHCGVMGVSED